MSPVFHPWFSYKFAFNVDLGANPSSAWNNDRCSEWITIKSDYERFSEFVFAIFSLLQDPSCSILLDNIFWSG